MALNGSSYNAYKQVDVETASQGKLIVLLFNGAIQRAEEAWRLIDSEPMDIQAIHENLIRALSPSNAQSNELPPIFNVGSAIRMSQEGKPWTEVKITATHGEWVEFTYNPPNGYVWWTYAPNQAWAPTKL